MSKKHKNQDRRNCGIQLSEKGCHNCANCIYVGEGDYFCDEATPAIVITGFSAPTDQYLNCNGRRWKRQ